MALVLTLRATPKVPLEAEAIGPDRLAGLSAAEVARLPVLHGNETAALGDFFKVAGQGDGEDAGEVRLIGDLSRVKLIGAGMARGRLTIEGNAGRHLGAVMTGGEIVVEGDADDWLGPEMTGGRILVKGNAGHAVGSSYRGSRIGMRGGEIVVLGRAGNEVGNGLRNGLIAVGGACGDFAGVNMMAGTIVVLGEPGIRFGAGLKRGTIVTMRPTEVLPTFTDAGTTAPTFLRLYLLHLRGRGMALEDAMLDGSYRRWSGDSVELNRGEILVLERP